MTESKDQNPPGAEPKRRPTVRPPLPVAHADVALGDIGDVCSLIRMGPSWVHNEVRELRFPQPMRFGPRCTRWRIADIRAWLIERSGWPQAEAAEQVKIRAKKASAKAAENRATRAAVAGQVRV